MATENFRKSTIPVNDTELYCEVRGEGPAILFVSGATGDAGIWRWAAESLARDHTVVAYDRRGNSRSRALKASGSTSVEEHADDAAGLLQELGIAQATVVGTSSGAIISLGLVERHPALLDGAVLHEPPLTQFLPPGTVPPTPASIEDFLRFALEDEVFDQLEPELRSRMVGNGDVFLDREFDHFEHYRPDVEKIRNGNVPIAVATGRGSKGDPNMDALNQGAVKLAEALDTSLQEMSGKHVPYLSCPEAFTVELRETLQRL